MASIKDREDYDADAISALVQFNPKFTFESWEIEIEVILEEDGGTFKDAVYEALVSNYRDNH